MPIQIGQAIVRWPQIVANMENGILQLDNCIQKQSGVRNKALPDAKGNWKRGIGQLRIQLEARRLEAIHTSTRFSNMKGELHEAARIEEPAQLLRGGVDKFTLILDENRNEATDLKTLLQRIKEWVESNNPPWEFGSKGQEKTSASDGTGNELQEKNAKAILEQADASQPK